MGEDQTQYTKQNQMQSQKKTRKGPSNRSAQQQEINVPTIVIQTRDNAKQLNI